jgi:hypothetical protein
VETVDAGWNLLVGTDRACIVHAARDFRPRAHDLCSAMAMLRSGSRLSWQDRLTSHGSMLKVQIFRGPSTVHPVPSQYFPPEVRATQTRRSTEMARHLVSAGAPGHMLTEVPNPSGIIPPQYRGKLYEAL